MLMSVILLWVGNFLLNAKSLELFDCQTVRSSCPIYSLKLWVWHAVPSWLWEPVATVLLPAGVYLTPEWFWFLQTC